jgi:hypothetical protein
MGQRTDRIFGAKPGIIGESAPMLAEITIRKSQDVVLLISEMVRPFWEGFFLKARERR